MTAEKLKLLLDSLVLISDRDFTVELRGPNQDDPKTQAEYFYRRKLIVLYGQTDTLRQLPCCLHELAHHVCREYRHRKAFIATCDRLVRIFNIQYRDKIKLELVFNKRRPATGWLKWRVLEKTEHHGNKGLKGETSL